MKLKHLILPMLAILMLATGCTKEYITENTYYGAQIKTYRFNIVPADWKRAEGVENPGSNNYLYCVKEIPAINQDVFDNGTVQAYTWNVYDVQNNIGSWNLLPFVYPLEVYVQDEQGNVEKVIVPENLRFEYELGRVTFVIQDLDGFDPEDMISTISVKVNVTSNM